MDTFISTKREKPKILKHVDSHSNIDMMTTRPDREMRGLAMVQLNLHPSLMYHDYLCLTLLVQSPYSWMRTRLNEPRYWYLLQIHILFNFSLPHFASVVRIWDTITLKLRKSLFGVNMSSKECFWFKLLLLSVQPLCLVDRLPQKKMDLIMLKNYDLEK